MALISRKFFLRRSKMLGFLDDIGLLPDTGSISAYIPPGFSMLEIEDLLYKDWVHNIPDNLSQLASNAKNGTVLFWGDSRRCLVFPPFPLIDKITFNGYVAGPLRQMLTSDYIIGLVLVHLGSYAVGICQGDKLISSKVGTGLIHGRHRKGGSSQQ